MDELTHEALDLTATTLRGARAKASIAVAAFQLVNTNSEGFDPGASGSEEQLVFEACADLVRVTGDWV